LDDKPERKPEKKPEKPKEQPREPERIKSDRPPVTNTANTFNQPQSRPVEPVRNMPPSNPNMNANPNMGMRTQPQTQPQDNGPVFPPPKREEKPVNPPPQDKPKSSGWKLFS